MEPTDRATKPYGLSLSVLALGRRGIRTAYLEVIESYEFALRHLDQRQYSTTSLNQGPKWATRGLFGPILVDLGRFRPMWGVCVGFVGQDL